MLESLARPETPRMNDRSMQDRQVAVVVEEDPDTAATLSLQLHLLGMEMHHCRHAYQLLEHFGCTHVQGFGLSRPVPAEAIPALVRYQWPIRARMAASGASLGNMP